MALASAVVLLVPEADPLVDAWRKRYDPSAALGVPAHVTLLYPWLPAPLPDRAVAELGALFNVVPPFELSFSSLGRFPTSLYLAPDKDGPIRALMNALFTAFPQCPPYGGIHDEVVPHLTVMSLSSLADFEARVAEVDQDLRTRLPVRTRIDQVTVLESDEAGRWRTRAEIPLLGEARRGS